MTDAIFHTLQAVMAMCAMHFTGPLDANFNPVFGTGKYAPGFEQCAAVQKAVDAEMVRRADSAAADERKADLARLKNALAALHGKPFKPEPQSAAQRMVPPFGEPFCVIPTESAVQVVQ